MDNTIETGGARTVQVEVLSDDVARAKELAAAFGVSVEQVYAVALEAALRVGVAVARSLGLLRCSNANPLNALDTKRPLKELYGDVARMCGVSAETIVRTLLEQTVQE
jgi:hypothetical protein